MPWDAAAAHRANVPVAHYKTRIGYPLWKYMSRVPGWVGQRRPGVEPAGEAAFFWKPFRAHSSSRSVPPSLPPRRGTRTEQRGSAPIDSGAHDTRARALRGHQVHAHVWRCVDVVGLDFALCSATGDQESVVTGLWRESPRKLRSKDSASLCRLRRLAVPPATRGLWTSQALWTELDGGVVASWRSGAVWKGTALCDSPRACRCVRCVLGRRRPR